MRLTAPLDFEARAEETTTTGADCAFVASYLPILFFLGKARYRRDERIDRPPAQ